MIERQLVLPTKPSIIAITGMPGARKTAVARRLSSYNMPYFTLSDVLRKELISQGLALSPRNFAKLAKRWRGRFGQDVMARRLWASITSPIAVVDGLRSTAELDFFRSVAGRFTLVLVHASPATRFRRFRRRRHPYLSTLPGFQAQEKSNLDAGIGNVIAQADYVLINEGYSGHSLSEQVDQLLDFLQKKGWQIPPAKK